MSERDDVIRVLKLCGYELDEEQGDQAYFKGIDDPTIDLVIYDITSLSEALYSVLNKEFGSGYRDGVNAARAEIRQSLGL